MSEKTNPETSGTESLVQSVSAHANRGALSIRWIATGATVVLTAAAVLCVGAVSERNTRTALNREIENRALLLGRNLALTGSGALLGEFPELTLQPVIRDMVADQPEVAFAVVVDHRGVIQGDPDSRRLGTRFVPPAGLRKMRGDASIGAGESLRMGDGLLVAEVPVREHGGRVIGRTLVGFRQGYIDRTLADSRRQQIWVMAVLLILGVISALLMMSHLLRPIGVLRAGLQRIGRGDLETPIRIHDRTELGVLADTVNEMTGALRRAQSEMVERLRLSHEVDLARQIQQSLLPSKPLTAGRFTVRGDQRAAAEVGGDYFDYMQLSDGRMALAVADVAGKGLGGCLVMSMLSALLRAYRETHLSPAGMLAALDRSLGESLQPGVFVTMFYGILDPATGRLVYACAGHNPLLLYRRRDGSVESLASKGIPLAAIRGGAILRTLRDAELTLEPGDVVVEYTDGYSEAFEPSGTEEFGLPRMLEVVRKTGGGGGTAVLAGLRAAVRRWSGDSASLADDETLLVLESTPLESAPAASTVAAPPEAAASAATAATVASVATSPSPAQDAVDMLEEAEIRGRCLRLPSQVKGLPGIQEWLKRVPVLRDLQGHEAEWLASALFEICANVAEHGYSDDGRGHFELWWLPPREGVGGSEASSAECAERALRAGCFVLRDDAPPYDPSVWTESDFSDPQVRRRGRGIGLDIIHRVMSSVRYEATTRRGNITMMKFGPRPAAESGKERVA